MGKEGTALGVARERFVDGLGRKAKELRGSIALLAATPDAERPREEMRRRLHALYASAQVFRIEPLAAALKERLQALDAVRDTDGVLSQDELDALAHLATTLPMLGRTSRSSSPSIAAPRPPSSRPPPAEPPLAPLPPSPELPRSSMPLPPPPSIPGSGIIPPPPVQAPDDAEDVDEFHADGERKKRTTADLLVVPPKTKGSDYVPPAPKTGRTRRTTQQGVGDSEAPPPMVDAEDAPSQPPSRRASFTMGSGGRSRPSTLPGEPLEMIVSVLVVDNVESQAAIRESLPRDRYEVLGASDPEQALRLSRSSAPDVVLVDAELALGPSDLVARLRNDPLTDFVPVVILHLASRRVDPAEMREHGADAVMQKPATSKALQRLVDRLAGAGADAFPGAELYGDHTIEEVADRLAQEIRLGIVEAAASGRDMKVPLGDGSELLAAAWSTIARVRAELAERSGGAVRFRDGAQRGGPAFMSLIDEAMPEGGTSDEVSLAGRRVIVADDDPAVVWFFAGLLREAGAHVVEVDDGRSALDEARRRRPDVVLSDILMPRMDGLALCRELSRDPSLAEVPVILLSWKEDFLQRMRELRSGASGYLRKEAESGQILAKVREVLRPRARLEAQLRAGGDVRGRVEGIGVLPLLRTIAEIQPGSRVTVRDAWNLFEIEIRTGELLDVTRTASDGSFARGNNALPQLLGVTAGRFTVAEATSEVRASLGGPVEEILDDAAQRLGAFVDAVSGRHLSSAQRIAFDEVLLGVFVRTSPGGVRALVEQLAEGASPREMLVGGDVSPQALETALVDLARRGAITSVEDVAGQDVVAAALAARVATKNKPSVMPPPQEEPAAEILTELSPPGSESEPPKSLLGPFDEPEVLDRDEPPGSEAMLTSPTNPPPSSPESERASADIEELMEAALVHPEDEDDPKAAPTGSDAKSKSKSGTKKSTKSKTSKTSKSSKKKKSKSKSKSGKSSAKPAKPEPPEDPSATTLRMRAQSASPSSASKPSEGGLGVVGWTLVFALLATVAFFGWRAVRGGSDRDPTPTPEPTTREGATSEPEATSDSAVEDTEAVPEPDPGDRPELSFGRSVTRVLDAGVPVAEGEGLLWVQEGEVETTVTVQRRDGEAEPQSLGNAPVAINLPEGEYEVVFRNSGERRRFVFLRAGHTRVVRPE